LFDVPDALWPVGVVISVSVCKVIISTLAAYKILHYKPDSYTMKRRNDINIKNI